MNKNLAASFCIMFLAFTSFAQVPQLIPQPVSLKTNPGHFKLVKQTSITFPAGNADCMRLATLLAGLLETPTGNHFSVSSVKKNLNVIQLKLNTAVNPVIGEDGYSLNVTSSRVTITANQTKGLFYGLQTLVQLLPSEIESKKKVTTTINWSIPNVTIVDYPRFGWRGLMLDVSRHFFPKQVIKNYIDEMAKYKFNVFHWHLSDDNGWRIEIKSFPQLTSIGAWRVFRAQPFAFVTVADPQPGEKATYGGFYTQDDIREIVKYAQDRFVTILPEIDIPAHSLALIASIPNISCTQLQYPVDPGTQFYAKKDNVLCVGNDSTYLVLDKIFTELVGLFPGKYIHIGGDEAYKGYWAKCTKCKSVMAHEHLKTVEELQSYFIKRIEKLITSKGRKMIGWDEILEGGLAPEATVMSWRGEKGGIEAAKMGHEVVMTPVNSTYLDMYQGDPLVEPYTYGKLLLTNCYNYEPVPNGVDARLVLGGQGNLWSESVLNERHFQYMIWPRGMALAEVFWSPKGPRNIDGFMKRVETHFKRLDAANVKHARTIYDPVISAVKGVGADTTLKVKLGSEIKGLDIYYSFDTSNPDKFFPKYAGEPLTIPTGASELRVITYRDDKPIGKQINFKLKDLSKRL